MATGALCMDREPGCSQDTGGSEGPWPHGHILLATAVENTTVTWKPGTKLELVRMKRFVLFAVMLL